MTPLDKTLKRTLNIQGVDYVITLTPEVLKLTRKGRRLGMELKWADLTSGESALAVALHASVGRFEAASDNTRAISEVGDDEAPVGSKKRSRTHRTAGASGPKTSQ